ncbi:hypothetical protein M378DRAFT_812280 [Amanita muscaria Koide BX008]|uniref:Uncharacterized protein n=1 Tax=Amanita muscaria (strain Koide BX008) TaxID=946122 RepID=A0A0C2SFK2_AMAMK|nr:hypothetical protein M378DRAFT_812280 [Amanita muscaria Koide BX008]
MGCRNNYRDTFTRCYIRGLLVRRVILPRVLPSEVEYWFLLGQRLLALELKRATWSG